MKSLLNIGIIGTGGIADSALAPALRNVGGGRLWSVMSRDLIRAQQFAHKHGAASPQPVYDSIPDMLQDPHLDAVIIATPDKLHAQDALRALNAGKHVLVEKPMCTDLYDAEQLITCSRKNNRKLAVAYHLRWHAGHRALRQKVLDNFVGTIRHVRAQWSWRAPNGENWRASQAVGQWWSLAAVGTHCLDLIRWFMVPQCGEMAIVKAMIASGSWGSPHDETALIQLQCASGATAELCSSVLFDAPSRLDIYGDKGYILCEGTLGRHGAGKITTHEGEFHFGVQNPFEGEIRNFIQSILNDQLPEVDGVEGMRNIEIITQAVKAAQ